ncbi:MAG: FIST C-terminal domain-containing protein [Elusimicrobia bacterium]|nr:FIST C-terminal domain-containing protein [Elusimicrobiota bacterium]
MRQALFVGLAMSASKEQPQQGDFLIRNVLGLDDRTGSLAVGSALRVGQTIQFHLRDSRRSNEDLRAVFEQAGDRITGTRGPSFFRAWAGENRFTDGPTTIRPFSPEQSVRCRWAAFFATAKSALSTEQLTCTGHTSCFGLFRPKS